MWAGCRRYITRNHQRRETPLLGDNPNTGTHGHISESKHKDTRTPVSIKIPHWQYVRCENLKEMDIIWKNVENLLQEFPEVGCLCKTCFARCGGEMKTKGNWEHCLRWGWTQMKTLWYYWTLLCINHSRGRSFRNIWNCHSHDILRAPKDLSFSRSVLFQICPISQGWQWPILEWGEHLS